MAKIKMMRAMVYRIHIGNILNETVVAIFQFCYRCVGSGKWEVGKEGKDVIFA